VVRVVDFRGNPVHMKRISGSSLIKAQEWIEFLDAHAQTFKDEQPWVTFAVQAIVNLHQGLIIMSRRVRKNQSWTGSMTMAEQTVGLVNDATERLTWFEKHSEQIDQTQLPEWAKFLFASIQGGLRMQVRISKDCEMILRKGHLLVNVSPRVDTIEKARELGEEVEQ